MQGAVALRPDWAAEGLNARKDQFVEIDAEMDSAHFVLPNRELIAITARLAPNFECYNHGNLPEPVGESRMADSTTRAARGSRLPKHQFHSGPPDLAITRVDVDVRGKRTRL